ncbi:hypothetical protein BD413DRAFT_590289 [Trametes elegans]|nr:hypothetical protein BD413DRAFT_590289 [Trametes elegans]
MVVSSLKTRLSDLRLIYLFLLVIRACFAVFGSGYIHPDEYFQNGEAVAGTYISLFNHLRTPCSHRLVYFVVVDMENGWQISTSVKPAEVG